MVMKRTFQMKLYDLLLFLYVVYKWVTSTYLPFPDAMKYPLVVLIFLLAFYLTFKYMKLTTGRLFLVVSFALVSFISFWHNKNYIIADAAMVLGSCSLSYDYIVRRVRISCLLLISLPFMFSVLGFIPDQTIYRPESGITAHSFGFSYYSRFAYPVMCAILCQCYIWRRRLLLYRVIVLFLLSYLLYMVSGTLLQVLTCLFLIAVAYITKRVHWDLRKKWIVLTTSLIYPLICIFTYLTSKVYLLSDVLTDFSDLNAFSKGRASLNETAFQKYDVTLFGQMIEMDAGYYARNYFYIDSGYVLILLEQGLLYTVIVMIFYMILVSKVCKAQNLYLLMYLMFFSIVNTFNSFLVESLYNPIILATFAYIIQNEGFNKALVKRPTHEHTLL